MIARARTVRDGRSGRRTAPSGAAADLLVALAVAGRTQHRCRAGSLVMAPTIQPTIVVGSSTCGHGPSDPEAGWAMTPARFDGRSRVAAPPLSRRRKVGADRDGSLARRRRSPLADR